jgi:integrase
MVTAFFRLRKSNAKTSQLIYVGLKYGQDQLRVSTGIKVLPLHWNLKTQEIKVKGFPEISLPTNLLEKLGNSDIVSFTNDYLNELKKFVNRNTHLEKEIMKQEIENYLNGKNDVEQFAFELNSFVSNQIIESRKNNRLISKEELINVLNEYLNPPVNGISLFEYINTFIDNSESGKRLVDGIRISQSTVTTYKTSFEVLKAFAHTYNRPVNFDTIDMEFYNDFQGFMVGVKNYAPSTMGKHIKTLKTFLSDATENGKNTNTTFQSRNFVTISSESDNIALSEKELDEFINLDLFDNERLDKVRDLFLVGANTGSRISDIKNIKPEDIKKVENGYNLETIQIKGRGRKKGSSRVIIPLNDIVMAIFNKYNNQLPKISDQNFNEYIKQVGQLCPMMHETYTFLDAHKKEVTSPKYELISSHTGRRSFATNRYRNGVPSKSIMAITGHQKEDNFLKYLKISDKEHAEIMRKFHKN